MRDTSRIAGLFVLAIIFAWNLWTAAPTRADDTPDRAAVRQELEAIAAQIRTDPVFLGHLAALERAPRERAVVDAYLRYLPLSPLDLLEIEMHRNRWEIVIPGFLFDWHRRWIALHEREARARYGDLHVDQELAVYPVPDAAPAVRAPTVGTNRNLAAAFSPAPERYQGEVQVAANPRNPRQVVAAANSSDSIGGSCGQLGIQAVFYSADGGDTWGYTCVPAATDYNLSCPGFVFGSDPAVTWNDRGEVFVEHMILCTATGIQFQFAIVVAVSSDGGATWRPRGTVVDSWRTPQKVEDKNFYAIDRHQGSPFYGRHYTCWDRNNDEKSAYSTNGGATWTEVDLPANPANGTGAAFDLGCEMEVARDGTVHVVWETLTCTSVCNNEEMYHARSVDGGVTWSKPVRVRDFNLVSFGAANPGAQNVRGIGPLGAVAIDNSGGPCDGTLYAAFGDYAASIEGSDVFVSRSRDGGASWQAPVRVNDDGAGGHIQFHPFLVTDPRNGNPVVAWHDARNDPANRAVEVYLSWSSDCGVTFQPNVKVSRPSAEFNESAISSTDLSTIDNPIANPNQFGEYLGLDVVRGTAFVAWTDSRHYFPGFASETQRENIGFAAVKLGTVP